MQVRILRILSFTVNTEASSELGGRCSTSQFEAYLVHLKIYDVNLAVHRTGIRRILHDTGITWYGQAGVLIRDFDADVTAEIAGILFRQ